MKPLQTKEIICMLVISISSIIVYESCIKEKTKIKWVRKVHRVEEYFEQGVKY